MNRTLSQISNSIFLIFLLLMGADAIAQGAKPVTAPTITRAWSTDVTATTAILAMTVDNPLPMDANVRFIYGTDAAFINGLIVGKAIAGAKTTGAQFSARLTGLQPKTTYYFRAVASVNQAYGTATGDLGSFVTAAAASPPVVTKTSHSNVTETTAELNMDVSYADTTNAATFFWGTAANLAGAAEIPAKAYATNAGGMSSRGLLSNLKPGTTYYYGAVVVSPIGQGKSGIQSFKTMGTAPVIAPNAPRVVNNWFSALTDKSVLLSMEVTNLPIAAKVNFAYGTDPLLMAASTLGVGYDTVGPGATNSQSHTVLNGLQPKTTYYFKAVASNANGTSSSDIKSFLTAGGGAPPEITRITATNIAATSAMLSAVVNNANLPGTAFFMYGTNSNFMPGTQTGERSFPAVTGGTGINAGLTGLAADTTYYYAAYATTVNGKTTSPTQSFKTTAAVAPSAPLITGISTSSVTDKSAQFSMILLNLPIATKVNFMYGTDPALAAATTLGVGYDTVGPSASGSQSHAAITGLQARTTYYLKAIATNANGTATSNIASFTTAGNGPPPVFVGVKPENIAATSAQLSMGFTNANLPATAYFMWSANANFTGATQTKATALPASTNVTVSTAPLTGLKADTTYYYIAQVQDANGIAKSSAQSFKTASATATPPPPQNAYVPPVVNGVSHSNITGTAALLSMVFNNGNYQSQAKFIWSTDPYFMGATYVPPEAVAASTSNVTAKVQLTGLKPNTTYYYKAAAVSPLGSAESAVQSFKTAPM